MMVEYDESKNEEEVNMGVVGVNKEMQACKCEARRRWRHRGH